MALLDVRELTVSYGGVAANLGIDLQVEPGTVVGLIGPNGAGKTTFVDAVTGFTHATTGRIEFAGTELTGMGPAARARTGLARTFQSVELFDDLTVRDNLAVAAGRPRWYSLLVDLVRPGRGRNDGADRVDRALTRMGLEALAERPGAALSHGQRTLVGMARALAAEPSLVLLDEPAAGLDTSESRQLGTRIRGLAAEGLSILLIDHDMELVMDVCDDVYVLDFGRVIAHGPPAAVRADPQVVAAYLGTGGAAAVGDVAGDAAVEADNG